MKMIFIFLLFVFNLGGNQHKLIDGKEGRIHCRLPYSATYTEYIPPIKKTGVTTYEQRWTNFWSVRKCGICSKFADKCSWLKKQKPAIKKEWTRTSQRKTVIFQIIRIPMSGTGGYGLRTFKLIDK